MFARGSMNRATGPAQGGNGHAFGTLIETILIPAQQGISQGAAGLFRLNYHLDGAVNIDVADTFSGTDIVSAGGADLLWRFGKQEIGTDPFLIGLPANFSQSWRGNHLSVQFDRDVVVDIPFHFGMPFDYSFEFDLTAFATSPLTPAVGYAEADFLNTGTLNGSIVFDSVGNPLSNPIVNSESGFDYTNPLGVPEPASAWLWAGMMVGMALAPRHRVPARN
jgi:hypothetical protein